jgi:methylmalonyl-CoA/ethylmalonyl-CoA epimerase
VSTSFPRLHHVGIVMPSIGRATELIELLGLTESYRGYVERYEATCIFTEGNGGSPIEFVVPSGGTLAKFNHGTGGLHHVALEVDSLDATTGDLATRGMSLLEATAVPGAGDFLCNFLSPGYTGGVIVEFVETPPAPRVRPRGANVGSFIG